MSEPRTDAEIEREAWAAIMRAVASASGVHALNLRAQIRKAFPFGPRATEREKLIWNAQVEKACSRSVFAVALAGLALALVLALPASAVEDAPVYVTDGKVWYRVKDQGALVMAVRKQKVPFSIRHPKLHRLGRRMRQIAIKLDPFIQVGGSVAQVLTAVKH